MPRDSKFRIGRHVAIATLAAVGLMAAAGASGISLISGSNVAAKSPVFSPIVSQGTPTPSPNDDHCRISLDSSTFRINEGAGQLNIGVTRICDRLRESKVDFFTLGRTASAGADFVASSGRIEFADGETNKIITLRMIDDSTGEINETFNLFLTDPGGSATLVNPSSALITIVDNDGGAPSPGPSPIPTPSPGPSPSPTPSPSPDIEHCQISLSASSYSVNENAVRLLVTVNRSCDRDRESKVDFFTRSGTASDRSDFTFASGRVFFGNGETSKTISLLITDDVAVEPNETFTLVLTDPGGSASLRAPSSAVITIIENDTGSPTSNPVEEPQFFVRQHYADFLNREPDSGGLGYWSGRISECGPNEDCIRDRRIAVSAAFFIEAEFQETGNYVYRLYKSSLGRLPAYSEFMPDRGQLVEGPDLPGNKVRFSDDWVQRPEFLERYPTSLGPFDYVNRLMDTAGLFPYVAERQRLVNEMLSGKTRAQVLREVVEFTEFKQREYNSAFVLMQYFGYLRRDPDDGGYDFWLNILNNRAPNNYRSMVCAFLTSAEMQNRFSPLRTRTDVECGR